jgi:hypothetical protein
MSQEGLSVALLTSCQSAGESLHTTFRVRPFRPGDNLPKDFDAKPLLEVTYPTRCCHLTICSEFLTPRMSMGTLYQISGWVKGRKHSGFGVRIFFLEILVEPPKDSWKATAGVARDIKTGCRKRAFF